MDQSSTTSGSPVNQNTDTNTSKSSEGKAERKRTKTGCLTCRQRRIKCGEQRPVCQNCIKSRRECQGYNQRVIFKEPLNAFRPPASVSRIATTAAATQLLQQQQGQFQQYEPPSQRQAFLQNGQSSSRNAPNRTTPSNFSNAQMHAMPIIGSIPITRPSHLQPFHPYQPGPGSSTAESSPDTNAPLTPSSLTHDDFNNYQYDSPQIPDNSHIHAREVHQVLYDYESQGLHPNKESHHLSFADEKVAPSTGWNNEANCAFPSSSYERLSSSNSRSTALDAFHQSFGNHQNYSFRPVNGGARINSDQYYSQYPAVTSESQQSITPPSESRESSYSPHFSNQHLIQPHYHEGNWPGSLPYHAPPGGEEEDDDLSDADSAPSVMYQFEPTSEAEFQDRQLKRNDLGNVMALQAIHDDQSSQRSFSTYLDDSNSLATYQPSSSPQPLEDPMTARIFLHFINTTGQNISMYERHPADPALMFSGRPVPHHNQHLWSYTMPTLALTNPGLLHAILAIGSLHMANLQETSTLPSLRHYHIALRRIAKSLNSPRRGHPATIAGTMLLGFYEVMSADHQKWTSHLLGAKQLIKEINFAEKTQEIKAIKKERQAQYAHQYGWDPNGLQRPPADYDDDLDENFISIITGQKLDADHRGRVVDEQKKTNNHFHTDRDIEIYENQRDLFWWFCKQDVYQSILSGNKLFVEYESWSDCPPRAPIGKWEASYGTFDHVILLLGRTADFASKDLARKKRVMQANGGVWRPHPTMQMPRPPPGHGPPQGQTTGPPKASPMPPFAGMMPVGAPATLPMGFTTSRELPKPVDDGTSLDVQTAKAIQEWEDIQDAFRSLTTRLGEEFRPIKSPLTNPIETPFGPAYQFKSYLMGGIWLNYYMGLIVHARSHPHMPPAAHMAAGIAASQTKAWSQELGRVCGGLVTPDSETELTTLHGSAMIECSVPMFTAAVQYQAPNEREWAVRKLKDIARLTGWKIAGVIAGGCEGAWIKAAEMGKGPPYKRPDGELGPGHDRPQNQSGEKGGVYWAFDGNRIGVVPKMEEVSEKDQSSDGVRRDRRAVLYENRDKEFGAATTRR